MRCSCLLGFLATVPICVLLCCGCGQDRIGSQSERFFHEGRYEESIKEYDRMLARDPNDWDSLYRRSQALSKLGRHKEALDDYIKSVTTHIPEWEKIAKAHPDAYGVLLEQADGYARIQKYPEACELCSQFINAHPTVPEVEQFFIVRAFSNEQLGEHEKTIEDCRRALEIDPNDGEAYYWRSHAHFHLGNKEQAEMDLKQSRQLKAADLHGFTNRKTALILFQNAAQGQ